MRAPSKTLITAPDRLLRALAALRRGEPVALRHHDGGAVLAAIETLDQPRFDALQARLGETFCVAVTARRAETLRARVYDGDVARIAPRSGASLRQLRAIADPTAALQAPLSGPYTTIRGESAEIERVAVTLAKRARLLPAILVWRLGAAEDSGAPDAQALAAAEDLALLEAEHLALLSDPALGRWREVTSARVPIAAAPNARLRLFSHDARGDLHYVVQIGDPPRDAPVLARLHSACATGDLFGSLKCDCGPQLAAALRQMGEAGSGVLVYLLQEGRGIGLANKLRAYRLQDDGFDTVEANHRLGFDDDERLLSDGGDILAAAGFRAIRLMTNNPAKLAAVSGAGVEIVERVPLAVGETPQNADYLATKARKSGHLL